MQRSLQRPRTVKEIIIQSLFSRPATPTIPDDEEKTVLYGSSRPPPRIDVYAKTVGVVPVTRLAAGGPPSAASSPAPTPRGSRVAWPVALVALGLAIGGGAGLVVTHRAQPLVGRAVAYARAHVHPHAAPAAPAVAVAQPASIPPDVAAALGMATPSTTPTAVTLPVVVLRSDKAASDSKAADAKSAEHHHHHGSVARAKSTDGAPGDVEDLLADDPAPTAAPAAAKSPPPAPAMVQAKAADTASAELAASLPDKTAPAPANGPKQATPAKAPAASVADLVKEQLGSALP